MTFNEYIHSIPQDRLEFMMKNGKRSSVLDNYDFETLELCRWKVLKEIIPELIKKGNFEKLIVEMFRDRGIGKFQSDVNYMDFNEVLYFLFWVLDEIARIVEMEMKSFVSEPDIDMLAAGIQDLNKYGDLNTIDSLAGGDVLKWEAIKNLPYHQVFYKQMKQLDENRIEKNLIKIKTPKKP